MIPTLALLSALPVLAETGSIRAVQKGDEIILLQKSSAAAQELLPQLPDLSDKSVAALCSDYVSAVTPEEKLRLLAALRQTPPRDDQDLRGLLSMFLREDSVRDTVERCLRLLAPDAQMFGPYFSSLIEQEDSLVKMFGMAGALRLHYGPALPLLRKLTQDRFSARRRSINMFPKDSDKWQTQYAALNTLASWEGRAALPLLLRKAKEAPEVAGLAATHFWEEGFDKFVEWSRSRSAEDQEAAQSAWSATVPDEALRAVKPKLLALVLNRRMDQETRHRAAVKLGLAAEPQDVALLLEKREAALKDKDEKTRLIMETAIFASRDARAIPLLLEHVRANASPWGRASALLQLKGMLEPARYEETLAEFARKDSDQENRSNARQELEKLRREKQESSRTESEQPGAP